MSCTKHLTAVKDNKQVIDQQLSNTTAVKHNKQFVDEQTCEVQKGQGCHVGQYHQALTGQALMPGQTQVAQVV